jgi:hypothetical protein
MFYGPQVLGPAGLASRDEPPVWPVVKISS